MNQLADHERPLLLVLKEDTPPAEAFAALLAHPDVAAYDLPSPWESEKAGVDLLAALPDLDTLTTERLPKALEVLVRLHTPALLDELSTHVWREVDEQVRSFFLKRPVMGTLASIVRLAPKSADLPPPREFVEEQVFVHRFEMEYRLHPVPGDASPNMAPAEEGSLVLYPFDVANQAGRRQASLPETGGPVLEAFAYGSTRARHASVLEDVAHGRGWQVLDPL